MISVKTHYLGAAGICVIATATLFAGEHGVDVVKAEALHELWSKTDGSGGSGVGTAGQRGSLYLDRVSHI